MSKEKIEIYLNRKDPDYHKDLAELLDLENLIANAIEKRDENSHNYSKYKKRIRIEFHGLSATSLLDSQKKYASDCHFDKLEKLFDPKSIRRINELDIDIKVRFLFPYPYSTYMYSLIQAESSKNRSGVNEFLRKPDFRIIQMVDNSTFSSSRTINILKRNLMRVESLYKRIKQNHWTDNQLLIRFTPFSPHSCLLIINNTAFYDSYQFSKQSYQDDELMLNSPIMRIGKYDSEELTKTFCSLADHFRYCWRHDLTLDLEDATSISENENELDGISSFKTPEQIDFSGKIRRLKARSINKENIDADLNRWKSRTSNLFKQFTLLPQPIPDKEIIFISCTWKDDLPDRDAKLIRNMLNEDLGEKIFPNIVNTEAGTSISETLYSNLRFASVGIVILAPAYETKHGHISKPNIYHEYGFLMSSVKDRNIFPFLEKTVKRDLSSNIAHLAQNAYKQGEIEKEYPKLLYWLSARFSHITERDIKEILKRRAMTLPNKH